MGEAVAQLLQEYVLSGDPKEAFNCLGELKAPWFHHELVKKALILHMEATKPELRTALIELLRALRCDSSLLPHAQLQHGLGRIYSSLDDLALDIPNVVQQLAACITALIKVGAL